jgi:branched-chain amino acid transport system ATP-binding protein
MVANTATARPETNRSTDTLLAVEGVTVRFGGLTANNDVTLGCHQGLITALLGPNGAGKTTLFNVITGAQSIKDGRVFFAGVDVTKMRPHHRAQLGVARTFQNIALARDLSVFENVLVGAARYRTYGPLATLVRTPRVRRDDKLMCDITARVLAILDLSELAGERAGNLSYGQLRRVEIARALAMGPRLLMLDEPTAGMDRTETEELGNLLLDLRTRLKLTIFVVEHDIEFVHQVADHACVLDFGQLIADGSVSEVLSNAAVQDAYLGTMTDA